VLNSNSTKIDERTENTRQPEQDDDVFTSCAATA